MTQMFAELVPAFGYWLLVAVPYWIGKYAAHPNRMYSGRGPLSRLARAATIGWIPAVIVAGAERNKGPVRAIIFIAVAVAATLTNHAPNDTGHESIDWRADEWEKEM
jgi:hypothetical protein